MFSFFVLAYPELFSYFLLYYLLFFSILQYSILSGVWCSARRLGGGESSSAGGSSGPGHGNQCSGQGKCHSVGSSGPGHCYQCSGQGKCYSIIRPGSCPSVLRSGQGLVDQMTRVMDIRAQVRARTRGSDDPGHGHQGSGQGKD